MSPLGGCHLQDPLPEDPDHPISVPYPYPPPFWASAGRPFVRVGP